MPVDLSLFDFELPPGRIAQTPAAERDAARLLVLPRSGSLGAMENRTFRELPALLRRGDVLVLNETAVFPARLLGKRAGTGGKVEVLLLADLGEGRWEALVRSKRPLKPGEPIELEGGERVSFDAALGEGRARVAFGPGLTGWEVAERAGHVPLPPYVRGGGDEPDDRARYQTVYAR